MTEQDTKEAELFEQLRRRKQASRERRRRLAELGQQWDSVIRRELRRLAELLWPRGHALGVVPARHYRLRHRKEEDTWLWWIERDIAPHDLYRCEAYRVTLELNASNEPVVSVEDATTVNRLADLSIPDLQAALAKAGENAPLVIPRTMGKARD